jgi:hypothetical protein
LTARNLHFFQKFWQENLPKNEQFFESKYAQKTARNCRQVASFLAGKYALARNFLLARKLAARNLPARKLPQ